jgi:predicted amidophosphoribosyltransferase
VLPQHSLLKKTQRIQNLQDAFDTPLPPLMLPDGGIIIILDDLTTTGATLSQAIKAMQAQQASLSKPAKVLGLAFSYVPI